MASTIVRYTSKGGRQRLADFDQAAERHLNDAGVLKDQNRLDNSCYHSGYSLECTLKLVLFLTNSPRWRGHLHELLPLIQGSAATYLDVQELGQMKICAPDSGWSPDMRYDPSGIPEQQAEEWLAEAHKLYLKTRTQLTANGVL